MGEIYTKAASVVVWPGAGDDAAKETVGMINTIFRDNIRPTATTKRQLPYEDKLGDAEKWNMIFPRLIGLLTRFFSYPWFRRVWVVQEAWLSRKAVVHCGDERVS
ncbi:hypothetical protein EDB80DRAFT_871565 [Ilyonectria destructans]|nr:hypothetical protein EDB80DRAFT_871565 [Ilyonectria destructans]